MNHKIIILIALSYFLFLAGFAQQIPAKKSPDTLSVPGRFGFGRSANEAEIALWDIDVRPDGKGLPPGQGNVMTGKTIYNLKCVACHGNNDEDLSKAKLPAPVLVSDTAAKSRPKAIGNYWPYATTLFDYIRRTMPYNQPGSLTDTEVYSLTAYLLHINKIIKPATKLNARNLPKIVMPAKKIFVTDDRKGGPEVK
jgi:cytochrome c